MFLRPHQFQAAERFRDESVAEGGKWDHHFNYGIRHIELSDDAIANAAVQITRLAARMKDGAIVSLQVGQEPDRVDVKEAMKALKTALDKAFQHETVVRVYLGVPKLKIGRLNVAQPGHNGAAAARYVEVSTPLQDESVGGNDQEIQLRRLNATLLLSTDDLSGYELLPICQIRRAGEDALPRLDDDYFPPVLSIDAWPPLGRDVVRAIYDIIGQKIEVLSSNVKDRGISFSSQEAGDLERLMMLRMLNEAAASLHVITFAEGVHPFYAYHELIRIVGMLSIFQKPECRYPEDIPRYDHDDLATIFYWAKKRIEDLIAKLGGYQYEQRYFVGAGKGMQVSLESKWLHDSWDWFVGVVPKEVSEKEAMLMLSPGVLDWKIGSAGNVDFLFKVRGEGLGLNPLKQAPRALPSGGDWIYYEVDKGKAEWAKVQQDLTLGLRVKEEMIQNLDSLAGQRDLIVATRTKRASLQFCLFAVPKSQ
jgi:type VI secretion system protein ImpJ